MQNQPRYNNETYTNMITVFFNDVFYLPGLSYGTRIQILRKYTEIVLRRLLNSTCDEKIELGNHNIKRMLDDAGYTEPLFRDSLEIIRNTGNDRSHTQVIPNATEEEFQRVLDSVFNIYGYLFYKYFKKWSFGSNERIVSAFSCLPPIIRHIALSALYEDDPDNPEIIEKLVQAKLKSFDKMNADSWVEEHKETLLRIAAPIDSDYLKTLISIFGAEYAVAFAASLPNMYDHLKDDIQTVDTALNSMPLYSDFESAKSYYEQYGIVDGNTQDVIEFNDLREFLFIGRRKKEDEITCIPEENHITST